MKRILLFVLLVMPSSLIAQERNKGIIVDVTGALGSVWYTHDSLVAPRKMGRSSIGNEASINGYYHFALKNPDLSIRAGLGYIERNMRMNQTSFGDFFIAIFSFGRAIKDSFLLNSMQLRTHYMNVPVGIFYSLTKNDDRVLQMEAGLQFNAAFLLNARANLSYSNSRPAPTPAQEKELKKSYTSTASKFVLGIHPRVDIKIRGSEKSGMVIGIQPLQFYVNSWNNRISYNHKAWSATFGVYYNL